MKILLTGFTGNIGAELAAALSGCEVYAVHRAPLLEAHPAHVYPVHAPLDAIPAGLATEVEAIVHAAADTGFRAPLERLHAANVEGTRAMLEFAKRCAKLRRFIHVSTVCVSGTTPGTIEECPISDRPEFLNDYERTKWEAERMVLAADVPAEIVRLSIVAGSERDGTVRRLGGLHHAMYWFYRGLIPLVPALEDSRVDVISTECAAGAIQAMLGERAQPGRITHAARGTASPRIGELLDAVCDVFARHHPGWGRGAIQRPVLANASTWRLFAEGVDRTGDAILRRVIGDAQAFLPILLHPRTYASRCAAGDWRALIENVVEHLIATNWHRNHA